MKIRKSASGNKVAELTQKDWESLGKKAGWLDDNGKLVTASEEVASEEEVKPSDEMERTAQPAVAPPRPKAPPTERPTRKKRRRRMPQPIVNPKPKAKEDEAFEEKAASTEEPPTIASELKRLLK